MSEKTIPAENLKEYIYQGITKSSSPDKLNITLPFNFAGESSAPLCLSWTSKGELTDNGRAIDELKKRVGDITPYLPAIRKIISKCGMTELKSNHTLVTTKFQTVFKNGVCSKNYIGALTAMLKAISLISIVDSVTLTD